MANVVTNTRWGVRFGSTGKTKTRKQLRQRDRETERQRDREAERQRDRETERQRDRERQLPN